MVTLAAKRAKLSLHHQQSTESATSENAEAQSTDCEMACSDALDDSMSDGHNIYMLQYHEDLLTLI